MSEDVQQQIPQREENLNTLVSNKVAQEIESLTGKPVDSGEVSALPRYAGAAAEALPYAIYPGGLPAALMSGIGGQAAKDTEIPEVIGAVAGGMTPAAIKGLAKVISQLFSKTTSTFGDLFSSAKATQSAKAEAKKIVESQIDAEDALNTIKGLKMAPPAGLNEYKRTAEQLAQPGAARLEETLRRETRDIAPGAPNFSADVIAQDSAREQVRQTLLKAAQGAEINAPVGGKVIREALAKSEDIKAAKTKALMKKAGLTDTTPIPARPINIAVASKVDDMTKELIEKTVPTSSKILDKFGDPITGTTTKEVLAPGSKQASSGLISIIERFNELGDNVTLKALQNYRSALGKFAGAYTNKGSVQLLSFRILYPKFEILALS
jgi:hypothetical protein